MDTLRDNLVDLILKANDAVEAVLEEAGSLEYTYKDLCSIEADYMITNGVTVQEWISVDDRLPENDVMVIGYTPCDGFMFVGYYHEEPKYDWKVWRIVTAMRSTKVMTKKVTHWMPLPQPPKEE